MERFDSEHFEVNFASSCSLIRFDERRMMLIELEYRIEEIKNDICTQSSIITIHFNQQGSDRSICDSSRITS